MLVLVSSLRYLRHFSIYTTPFCSLQLDTPSRDLNVMPHHHLRPTHETESAAEFRCADLLSHGQISLIGENSIIEMTTYIGSSLCGTLPLLVCRRMTDRVFYIVPIALMLYEYCITLEYEVSIGWRRQRNVTSLLFLLNRYIMLCMVITEILSMLPDISWVVLKVRLYTDRAVYDGSPDFRSAFSSLCFSCCAHSRSQ